MRNRITLMAALTAAGIFSAGPGGTPAFAQTVGVAAPVVSVDEARDIAVFNGVVIIRRIEFDEGAWKIEGRDRADRRVEMKIDPHTGEIAELEKFD